MKLINGVLMYVSGEVPSLLFYNNKYALSKIDRYIGSSVFNDTISGVIFRSKRDEVTEWWRRLHNEELYDQPSPKNVIRVMK